MNAPSPSAPAAPPGRFRRALGALGATLGLTCVFVGALVVSVAVHLDAAPTRRVIRVVANDLLGSLFNGKIIVGEIDRLDLHGLAVRSAVAQDPRGVDIARIDGLRADVDVVGLVRSALGSGDLRIAVPLIHLDGAQVLLDRGPAGVPGIAEAFILRAPGPPPPPSARQVRVALDRIEIDHVVAHGEIAPPTTVDGEVAAVVASVQVGPDGVAVEVSSRVDARAPVPQPVGGDAAFHLRVPSPRGAAPGLLSMWASFDGSVGDAETHATASMEGAHVTAGVELPSVTPAVIASFVPGGAQIPLRVPVTVLVDAEGDLPELTFHTWDTFEDGGSVGVDGRLTLGAPVRLDTTFDVRALDPRIVLDVADATPLDATGHVKLEIGGGDVHLTADASTEPLTIAGNVIPAVEAEAELAQGIWRGSARVREEGAPTSAVFSFDEADGLRFEVESRVASLHAVTRLRAPVFGSAEVKVTGTLKDGELDAKVKGSAADVRAPGGVELDSAEIDGRAHGPLAKLSVDASVHGRGLRAGGYVWERVDVHAGGPVTSPHVHTRLDAGGGESIEASGALDARTASVRNLRVHVKRKDGEVDGEVARVGAGPGGVVIEGIALHGKGVGHLDGGLAIRDKEIVGRLQGKDVDLAKVASLAGLHQHLGGLANVDVELSSSAPGHRKGHVDLELQGGELPGLDGVSALLTATFDGDRVRVDGLVRLVAHASTGESPDERCDGSIAQLRITGGDGRLAGPLLDPETWRRGSGKVDVAAEEWNLRCLSRLAPLGFVVSGVRGKLTTRATVVRAPGATLPSVRDLLARTRGLEVDGPVAAGSSRPAWDSHGVDVEVTGSVDGVTGKTEARVSLHDGSLIAAVGASATLDLRALLEHPEQRQASLLRAPMSVKIEVPRRAVGAFGTLPSFVRENLPPFAGDVQLDGLVKGTLAQPQAELSVSAWGLAHVLNREPEPAGAAVGASGKGARKGPPRPPPPPDESPWSLPIDLRAKLTYDGGKAKLDAHVEHDGKEVIAADGEVAVALADLLAGRAPKLAGGVSATFTEVPVGDLPFLDDRGVAGHLSGTVALAGVGVAPTLKVDLALPDLKIGSDLVFDKASLAVDITRPKDTAAGPERGAATTTFVLSSKTGGKLEASAITEILWKNGLVPTIDDTRPADMTATASKFRIAALGPFVASVLSRIDGVLDGSAHVGWARKAGADAPDLTVNMNLTDGIVYVPQLGQELHGARVSLTGGERGLVRIQGIQAEGTKGRVTGAGQAQFDGLRFVGADTHFDIADLPLTLEGVPFGDARGQVTVVAKRTEHDLAITVGIPTMHVELPGGSARAVQGLDPSPDIEIVSDRHRAAEPVVVEASKLTLVFNIGKIEIKGSSVDVDVAGVQGAPLRIELADKTRISGDIKLTHGRIEVLHKPFDIEQGLVHMRPEDPGNPYINVTARWDSPDGPIFIEYAGVLFPITPEKIKYRSPSIPEDRIMATLLFGGVEQSTLGATNSSTAGGVPGQSLATQLIAAQFSAQIATNISTSIGANDDGTLRPGLVYNSGNKVIELSTYGATGQNIGGGAAAAKGQHTLITVDWRFWHNWLLRGRVDVGSDQTTTGLDMLWQYRY